MSTEGWRDEEEGKMEACRKEEEMMEGWRSGKMEMMEGEEIIVER